MGPSPSSRTHTIGDPHVPVKLQHKTPVVAPMKTTDPGHSVWGPCLSHCFTPLPKTQISEAAKRATPPPSRRRRHHRTMHTNSSPPEPMDPLHLPANTNQAHLICHPTQATPTTIHHHCLAKSGLQMRRLQEGYDANGTADACPRVDWIFTQRPHMQ